MAVDLEGLFDRYDRNARLKPALFVVLPLLLVGIVWLPGAIKPLGSVAALLVTCGATFLLSRIARSRGRALQETLMGRAGEMPSTLALRHRDLRIDGQTKERYHTWLRSKGLRIPTTEEEGQDPRSADECYRSAVKWLLEATRDTREYRLLFNENIDYGFRRNLVGLKPIGIALTLAAMSANGILLYMHRHTTDERFWVAGVVEISLSFGLIAWTFLLNRKFVLDASWTYAERLLSTCDVMAQKR